MFLASVLGFECTRLHSKRKRTPVADPLLGHMPLLLGEWATLQPLHAHKRWLGASGTWTLSGWSQETSSEAPGMPPQRAHHEGATRHMIRSPQLRHLTASLHYSCTGTTHTTTLPGYNTVTRCKGRVPEYRA